MDNILLEVNNISKSFGGIQALSDVSFVLNRGEVLAVAGENGAGKSTMMKILTGSVEKDSGEIYLNGEEVNFNNPFEATHSGISIVYQEPTIFSDLNVLENMFLGNEITYPNGNLNWKAMVEIASNSLKEVGLNEEVLSKNMGELSIGNQQLVLIARGIQAECKVLILDEPTSILSKSETDTLFNIIGKLRQSGQSIIYISHRMEEIFEISDHILVLRDGEKTDYLSTKEVNASIVLRSMSGREINTNVYIPHEIKDEAILEFRNLSNNDYYKDINLQVRKGEILGVYGLVGSGRSELMRTVFGDIKRNSGDLIYKGEEINFSSPKESVLNGIYYMPEDRGTQGLFKLNSVKENLTAPFLNKYAKVFNYLDNKFEKSDVQRMIEQYSIKTNTMDNNILNLSGGNQQKVLFSRWLLELPDILILDEPTRGIDVGTKTEIHKYIMDLSINNNVTIILVSSDITEILELSDRVFVMKEGKQMALINREDLTEELVLKFAIGI